MHNVTADSEKFEKTLASKLPKGVGRATKYLVADPESQKEGLGIWSAIVTLWQ